MPGPVSDTDRETDTGSVLIVRIVTRRSMRLGRLHRVHRVHDEVEDHLLELNSIAVDARKIRIELR